MEKYIIFNKITIKIMIFVLIVFFMITSQLLIHITTLDQYNKFNIRKWYESTSLIANIRVDQASPSIFSEDYKKFLKVLSNKIYYLLFQAFCLSISCHNYSFIFLFQINIKKNLFGFATSYFFKSKYRRS